ncbi:hypothetical protein RGUI_2754 [Rhodovulum sp. P5]|uniref:hypothetical protein n=1 Tax=Rhodovulum sp. P5 TaxID=1564506 RepID=UPI0009C3B815|nr:hypothetical protein [Rhodovulum sp. P5]ARE40895.1 hypothetical protein RGUI_2754 [Rhodovulum sp. P5]
MTNTSLPVLNPLFARSTVAAILALFGVLGPLLGGGLGALAADLAGNAQSIGDGAADLVAAVNAGVSIVGGAWMWWERRAPNYRLSVLGRIVPD